MRDRLEYVNNLFDKFEKILVFSVIVSLVFGIILMWALFNVMVISVIEQAKVVYEQIQQIPIKAYAFASGDAKCCVQGGGTMLEQITNIFR